MPGSSTDLTRSQYALNVLDAFVRPSDFPITEARTGAVQEKQKALLREIIQNVNDLFEGELTNQDKLVYVNNVIKG